MQPTLSPYPLTQLEGISCPSRDSQLTRAELGGVTYFSALPLRPRRPLRGDAQNDLTGIGPSSIGSRIGGD